MKPPEFYEQSSKHWPTRNNLWRGAGSIPLLRWRETDRNRKQSFLGDRPMRFKDTHGNPTLISFGDKRWGPNKKWIDHAWKYFTVAEKQVFILRPKPFTPVLFKWLELNFLSLLVDVMPSTRSAWPSQLTLTTTRQTKKSNSSGGENETS